MMRSVIYLCAGILLAGLNAVAASDSVDVTDRMQ